MTWCYIHERQRTVSSLLRFTILHSLGFIRKNDQGWIIEKFGAIIIRSSWHSVDVGSFSSGVKPCFQHIVLTVNTEYNSTSPTIEWCKGLTVTVNSRSICSILPRILTHHFKNHRRVSNMIDVIFRVGDRYLWSNVNLAEENYVFQGINIIQKTSHHHILCILCGL